MRTLFALIILAISAGCGPSADCGFSLVQINDPLFGDRLELSGPSACVKLVRRDLSEPDFVYKAYPWALEAMTVSHPEGHEEVTEALEWQSSHHNWADEARGRGALYDYRVEVNYGPGDDDEYGWTYTLTGLDDDGEVALGPFDLEG